MSRGKGKCKIKNAISKGHAEERGQDRYVDRKRKGLRLKKRKKDNGKYIERKREKDIRKWHLKRERWRDIDKEKVIYI